MALIECPNCGKSVSDSSKVCIHCGYNLEDKIEEQPATTFFALPPSEQDKISKEFDLINRELAKKYNKGNPPLTCYFLVIVSALLLILGVFLIWLANILNGNIIGYAYLCGSIIILIICPIMIAIFRFKLKKFTKNNILYKITFEKWLKKEKNLSVAWDLNKKENLLYEQMKKELN